MDDKQITYILTIISIIFLGIISIGACLYAIPLCFIRRFHTPPHLLSLNVCAAIFIFNFYWSIFFILNTFYTDILVDVSQICISIVYLQISMSCGILYSLCVVALNRLFSILYRTKILFHTKKWVTICVSLQWIIVMLISLPFLASKLKICSMLGLEFKFRLYALLVIAIIPIISLAVMNSIIFIYTRRSSRRVQPMNSGNILTPALSNRDSRLLKHMIFMSGISFCGWVPISTLAVLNWNGTTISSAVFQGFRLLQVVGVFIVITDLYWYNHELRRYLTNKLRTM